MKINFKKDLAIVTTNICDVNNKEMRQMHELKERINDVLASHKPNSKEKKYISDDDLKLMHAILHVFTKEFAATQESAFDDALKKFSELEKADVDEEKDAEPEQAS